MGKPKAKRRPLLVLPPRWLIWLVALGFSDDFKRERAASRQGGGR